MENQADKTIVKDESKNTSNLTPTNPPKTDAPHVTKPTDQEKVPVGDQKSTDIPVKAL